MLRIGSCRLARYAAAAAGTNWGTVSSSVHATLEHLTSVGPCHNLELWGLQCRVVMPSDRMHPAHDAQRPGGIADHTIPLIQTPSKCG